MSHFILIHGAWHGGWCWHKLVRELESSGHSVTAPDLPCHGDDRTAPQGIDVSDYADLVCSLVDAASDEVVLVGHSLGGLTISQVAERRPDRLQCLVYLAALVPTPGATPTSRRSLTTDALLDSLRLSEDGSVSLFDLDAIREVFYADCSDEDIAFARSRLCGEPAAAANSAVEPSQENWGRVSRDYIVCLQDQAIPASAQQALAEESGCRNVYSLDASHSPFFSAPADLARILGQIAES